MYKLVIIEDEHIIRKWLRYAIDYKALDILVTGEAKDGKAGAALIRVSATYCPDRHQHAHHDRI